jgi:hypothetical protein
MNFETPQTSVEKELRYPSLEEVKAKMEKIVGKENLEVLRILKDEGGGITLYEASTIDENGDAFVYVYRKAGEKSAVTNISVEYYLGALEDGTCVGGKNLAVYNETAEQWSDAVSVDAETPPSAAEPVLPAISDIAYEILQSEANNEGILKEESKEKILVQLQERFDSIESALGSTDVEVITKRELEDPQGAEEVRSQSLPFHIDINNALMALNKSKGIFQIWNPEGHLTEDEFNALNARRKVLDNAIGSKVKDPITFKDKGIRHNIHKL